MVSDCRVILLAGPSGSGKSHLVHRLGMPVLRLDDFYHHGDHPGLPARHGIVDWDHPASWDHEAALSAVRELLSDGSSEVPIYAIAQNRAVGSRRVELGPEQTLVAEGIFAPEMLEHCRTNAIAARGIWLDRPRTNNFARRLRRDLAQRRKPPAVLVRRGVTLMREEPALRSKALTAGMTPMSMRSARELLQDSLG